MHAPFFHHDSGCVRFWVPIAGIAVESRITREMLHHRYAPRSEDEDPLAIFNANTAQLENAVRRRVVQGAIEPVILRETDLAP